MRIAWFAPAAPGLGDTAPLVAELRARHEIVRYDAASAHDFVWQHARNPFDLPVYELSDTPEAAFVWPYLLHHPGLLRLRDASLRTSRGGTLLRARRRDDYHAELRVSPRMLRVPLLASRMTVVSDESFAGALRDEHPGIEIAHAPPCGGGIDADEPTAAGVAFGAYDTSTIDAVRRAAQRARDTGSAFELRECASAEDAVRAAHVVFALPWPASSDPPVAALAAMSAARAVIVHESEATAGWPALDPQTWVPRSLTTERPIVVSIDPRDEEHSLMLSIRRLAADAALRQQLGRAAQAWWRGHATPAVAAAAWEPILRRAAARPAPPRRADWPPHLTADGTSSARTVLGEFGVSVDFL